MSGWIWKILEFWSKQCACGSLGYYRKKEENTINVNSFFSSPIFMVLPYGNYFCFGWWELKGNMGLRTPIGDRGILMVFWLFIQFLRLNVCVFVRMGVVGSRILKHLFCCRQLVATILRNGVQKLWNEAEFALLFPEYRKMKKSHSKMASNQKIYFAKCF